jgi:hypothetical protein
VCIHLSILEVGNKTPMEGVTETKYGVETEEMTIYRLTHLWVHPINHHQTQALLQIPTRASRQEPDKVDLRVSASA